MSHPEFFWNLKCSYCPFKSGSAEGSRPLSGIGVRRDLANWTRNTFFPFFSRAAAGGARGEEKSGTAPRPRQRAASPLQSRLTSGLTSIERQFEKFGMTHEKIGELS